MKRPLSEPGPFLVSVPASLTVIVFQQPPAAAESGSVTLLALFLMHRLGVFRAVARALPVWDRVDRLFPCRSRSSSESGAVHPTRKGLRRPPRPGLTTREIGWPVAVGTFSCNVRSMSEAVSVSMTPTTLTTAPSCDAHSICTSQLAAPPPMTDGLLKSSTESPG